MGIPGILKEVGRGERIALSKLAVEHLERTRRPLRIAIDAAIWNFQNQAGQGGRNPELRTLFYRLLKLLALPIHAVFVYDGKNKPLTKRGKTVTAYGSCIPNEMSKKLVQLFRYPHHTAPGEAEAECAFLQKHGVVDAVMSQDVDAIMFGSGMTLRNWTKEGTRGNKNATHIDVLRLLEVKEKSALTPEGLILVALLSGGDYDPDGVPGFGVALACEIAKAGFAEELLELAAKDDEDGLREWRERLQVELETNESGYFKIKRKTLSIPANFPDRALLAYYTNPAVSPMTELPILEQKWEQEWKQEIDVTALRQYVADRFDWLYDTGAKKLTRCLAPSLLSRRLLRSAADSHVTSIDQITERRMHFVNDGMPELRVKVTPGDIVGINIDAEERNPGWAISEELIEDDEAPVEAEDPAEMEDTSTHPPATQRTRKTPPWDPAVPEKMWIPETILQLGVPVLVEQWQQKQRDILADPVKFATRKAKPKTASKIKDSGMRAGALDSYFGISKPGGGQAREVSTTATAPIPQDTSRQIPVKQRVTTRKEPTLDSEQDESHLPPPSLTPAPGRNRIISNFLRELESTPSEPGGCITIESSPPVAIAQSSPDVEERTPFSPTQKKSNSAESQALPATVTQRTTRSAKPTKASPGRKAPSKLPEKALMPVQSFFGISKKKQMMKPLAESASNPMLPPDLSTGLKVDLMATKTLPVPRDSLPGTWRELDPGLIDESSTPRTRARPRVSIVDLTEG